ncbi:UNVERIFIED_CONTAM: hypothetical protein H355_015439 [Colinus virginianus]|nr:hypothetical protein H355_015439 [Colinus virginianus]
MEPRGRSAAQGAPWGPGAAGGHGQGMDSPYTNGAYAAPYPPHYSAVPQPRPYSSAGPPRSPYTADSAAAYRPPPPAPPWGCGTQDCPAEGCSLRRQQAAGYSPPQESESANQHSYYPDVNPQHSGITNDPKAPAQLNPKSSPSNPKVQYSAQPHLYHSTARKQEPGPRAGSSSAHSAAIQPEIQRILHVTGEAEQLEQEVDEFVGKKTDKSYRLLEEMLTKLLLELDSIETGGQDSVRQARKEAVHRIQAVLEKLERKGL